MRLSSFATLTFMTCLLVSTQSAHSAPLEESVKKAELWLVDHQLPDGGFGDPAATAAALLALKSVDPMVTPEQMRSASGRTPLDVLVDQARAGQAWSLQERAMIIIAVDAYNLNPTVFGGTDLAAPLYASYDARSGRFSRDLQEHILAILALAKSDLNVPASAVQALVNAQDADGMWQNSVGELDLEISAWAAQALIATGLPAWTESAGRAIGKLHSLQNADGGFPKHVGQVSHQSTTSTVAQLMLTAGIAPEAWAAKSGNALSWLIRAQSDEGSFGGIEQTAIAMASLQHMVIFVPVHRVFVPPIPGLQACVDGSCIVTAPQP